MLSSLHRLPRTVWVLFAGTIVNRVGFLVSPFLVFYLGSRGVHTGDIPYVLGGLGAGNLIGPALGGMLADRFGRRSTLLLGMVGMAAAEGLLYLAPGVATMALAATLLTGTGSVVPPAVSALYADAAGPEGTRTAFALYYWGINLGTAAAGILGGVLAEHGYWILFTVDAGTALGFALIAVTLLPRDRPVRAEGDGVGYGVVLRDPLMRLLLPLLGVLLAVYSLTECTLPLAIRDHGLRPSTYGLMAAINAAIVVVAQPVAVVVTARFPQQHVFVVGSVVTSVGVALTGLAHDLWTFAATVVIWSLGEASVGGAAGSLVASLAPAHARGRYQGSFQWIWGLARFSALALGTALYTGVGPAALWTLAGLLGTVAPLAIMGLGPALDRRSTALQPAVPASV